MGRIPLDQDFQFALQSAPKGLVNLATFRGIVKFAFDIFPSGVTGHLSLTDLWGLTQSARALLSGNSIEGVLKAATSVVPVTPTGMSHKAIDTWLVMRTATYLQQQLSLTTSEPTEKPFPEAIRDELLTQNVSQKSSFMGNDEAVVAQADMLGLFIDRGVIKWPKDPAAQLEVINKFLQDRQADMGLIESLVTNSNRVIDIIYQKYGGYIISDPSKFNPLLDKVLIVDDATMKKISRNQDAFVPAGLYVTKLDTVVLNRDTPEFEQSAQRFLDHELSHQNFNGANNEEFTQVIIKHFGEDDYKGWRRLIYEGRNELITYYIAKERALQAGQPVPKSSEFSQSLYESFAAGFDAFNFDIRNELLARGLSDAEADNLLLSIGIDGYTPLVKALGSWDNLLGYFDHLTSAAEELRPIPKPKP